VPTSVTAAVTGLSDRSVRRHPKLPHCYISRDRYGQRVSDIRALLSNGVPPEEIRKRVSPRGQRLLSEIQSAPSRAEAERILNAHDDSWLGSDERDRLNALLIDALNELPE
jgi:hypothetical protein